jgi:hypothetical protein
VSGRYFGSLDLGGWRGRRVSRIGNSQLVTILVDLVVGGDKLGNERSVPSCHAPKRGLV